MIWFYTSCLLFSLPLFYRPATTTVIISQPELPDYYTVALFEHNRKGINTTNSGRRTPSQMVALNLDYYQKATEVAKSKGADIIIFPEYGITTFLTRQEMKMILEEVPDPRKVKSNPCIQADEFVNRPMMHRLSCMARHNNIVIVANTGDIQPCTKELNPNCPDDGAFHFNANVAFDRDGTILSKYYKEYLFYEIGMDLPQEPQDPVFTTDFGTFAMFICFDINWKPIVDAARNEDVDNIILSSMWIDSMPLWNAVQLFEAWALGNNATFLVVNNNVPGYGSVGSGVFTGHMGALKYTFNPDGLSKLVISRAPRSKHQKFPFPNFDSSITVITANGSEPYDENEDGKDIPKYCYEEHIEETRDINKDYRCFHEKTINNTFVKLTKNQDRLEVCNNGLCCSLEYSAEEMNETYYLSAMNGTYELADRYYFCRETCFVVRCDDSDDRPCADYPLKANTVFNKFELRSNFTTKFIYPSVLKSDIRLAPVSEWKYGQNDESVIEGYLEYESDSQQPLLVAALNGRCYDRDPPYRR